MKNKRLHKYLQQKAVAKNSPVINKQDIQNNSDQHIDQDFPGYPNAPSNDELIKPKTGNQKKTASMDTKDGEKIITSPHDKKDVAVKDGGEESDGSANAFEGTERVQSNE